LSIFNWFVIIGNVKIPTENRFSSKISVLAILDLHHSFIFTRAVDLTGLVFVGYRLKKYPNDFDENVRDCSYRYLQKSFNIVYSLNLHVRKYIECYILSDTGELPISGEIVSKANYTDGDLHIN